MKMKKIGLGGRPHPKFHYVDPLLIHETIFNLFEPLGGW